MPKDSRRKCPCGCDEYRTPGAIRRHLHNPTTKSVLVAQQHNYREQRLNLLRIEARELSRLGASSDNGAEGRAPSDSPPLDDDIEMDEPDSDGALDGGPMEEREADPMSSDSEGDPFEGRLDDVFLEDSDEEDVELGGHFQAAPWLQGLTAHERLEEVFNMDAASRGKL